MARSFGHEFLIKKYIELIRELGRFPIEGELRHKRRVDRSFPNHDAFNALGGKAELRCPNSGILQVEWWA